MTEYEKAKHIISKHGYTVDIGFTYNKHTAIYYYYLKIINIKSNNIILEHKYNDLDDADEELFKFAKKLNRIEKIKRLGVG